MKEPVIWKSELFNNCLNWINLIFKDGVTEGCFSSNNWQYLSKILLKIINQITEFYILNCGFRTVILIRPNSLRHHVDIKMPNIYIII